MNRYKRTDRISNLIHRAVSTIIDNNLRDARIGMVTVTGVEVTRDLKIARVYVSILGSDEEIKNSLIVLNNATNYIRSCLGEKVILKYTPALQFYYDSSTVDGMHMDRLLDEIKKES